MPGLSKHQEGGHWNIEKYTNLPSLYHLPVKLNLIDKGKAMTLKQFPKLIFPQTWLKLHMLKQTENQEIYLPYMGYPQSKSNKQG